MRRVALLALVVSGALVVGAGCGSGDPKKSVMLPGDAGAAGAADAGADAGGAAGAAEPGAAGSAGDAALGGAAGELGAGGAPAGDGGAAGATLMGDAGAAGAGPACVPSGSVTGMAFNAEVTFPVCRGSMALLEFDVTDSDQQYTCCGTSNAAYDFSLAGLSNNDGGGAVTFLVPDDAPLTDQAVTVDCGSESASVAIKVTDTAPPVATSVSSSTFAGGNLKITGSNLLGIDRVLLVPVDASVQQPFCSIVDADTTDTSVTCKVNFGTDTGAYRVIAFDGYCGSTAPLTVQVNPVE